MLQKAIHTAMSNHYYKFEGTIHKQVDGGPIGDVLAQTGTRLYMVWWDSEFKRLILAQITIKMNLRVLKRYVDDLHLKTGILPLGSTWDRNREEVYIKPQDQITQEEAEVPEDLRTARVYKEMANHVTTMFTWTEDTPSNHPDL